MFSVFVEWVDDQWVGCHVLNEVFVELVLVTLVHGLGDGTLEVTISLDEKTRWNVFLVLHLMVHEVVKLEGVGVGPVGRRGGRRVSSLELLAQTVSTSTGVSSSLGCSTDGSVIVSRVHGRCRSVVKLGSWRNEGCSEMLLQ